MKHLVIPDTQIYPGVKLDFIDAIGDYVAREAPDVLIALGDWWDFPSLRLKDIGKSVAEGRRFKADLECGNKAMDRLNWYTNKIKRKVFVLGNHEQRLERYVNQHPELAGQVNYNLLNLDGWQVIPFLNVVNINGIKYSHYFPRGSNRKIHQLKHGAPTAKAQAEREGGSCTSGHVQGLDYAVVPHGSGYWQGMIIGSCYLHADGYNTPAGNNYWRGLVTKHNVRSGNYDPEFVQLKNII